jgi:hypothetical protein
MPTAKIVIGGDENPSTPRVSPFEIESTTPALNGVQVFGMSNETDRNCDPWACFDFEAIAKAAFADHNR